MDQGRTEDKNMLKKTEPLNNWDNMQVLLESK